jgi:hypothetical protein
MEDKELEAKDEPFVGTLMRKEGRGMYDDLSEQYLEGEAVLAAKRFKPPARPTIMDLYGPRQARRASDSRQKPKRKVRKLSV